MSADHDDFAVEPVPGLPHALPEGERILWQGTPRWTRLARDVFHVPLVALYLAALIAWRAQAHAAAGSSAQAIAVAALGLAIPALGVLGLLCLLARLHARNTRYTITDRRVVIRTGIALTLSFNLPFKLIGDASLAARADGTGNIALAMLGEHRIGYVPLWPNVRPWRLGRPQPMLRAVPDAARVARLLGEAIRAQVPQAQLRAAEAAERPAVVPSFLPGAASA